MTRTHNYFPALDGLRAIAAFAVLWTHIERFKQSKGEPTLCSIPFNSFIGGLAVTLFFVLSGFLITDILLSEKKAGGSIQIPEFLRNRFLRIGPLYFLTLIAGYLVSVFIFRDTQPDPVRNGFLINLFMLSNIAFGLNLIPEILIQIWSIGTEVQFYILWPFVISRRDPKRLIMIFIIIVLGWSLIRGGLYLAGLNKSVLSVIMFRTRFDCMAIGGMAALMMRRDLEDHSLLKRLGKLIQGHTAGLFMLTLFLILLIFSWKFDLSLYPLYSILFACLIYRCTLEPPGLLTASALRWLGKISYGIYLIHHFAVYLVFYGLSEILGSSRISELFYFICASVLTIVFASISYFGMERKFLQMKH